MRPLLFAVLLLIVLSGRSAFAAVPPSVVLGDHWYRTEIYKGATFRWVDNDADIVVGGSGETTIDIDCEAGPGIGAGTFLLQVLDSHRHQVDAVRVNGRQTVQIFVPGGATYVLHTPVGGKRVAHDPRILNFRVFSIHTEPNGQNALIGDIAGPNVAIAGGWDTPEFFRGETFRWVDNNAAIVVHSPHAGRGSLQLLVERGPGMGRNPLRLTITDGHGHVTRLPAVGGRATLVTPLTFEAGANQLRLHTDGGGAHIPGDHRVLDFRVFSVRATVPG